MIKINDIEFTPLTSVKYKYDYVDIANRILQSKLEAIPVYRKLLLDDLFFLVYFVFGIPTANHPFIIQACKDVESGQDSYTLDLWGREHYKSTIITKGETIQKMLKNSEERIAIFSHTRPAAKAFLRSIKQTLEGSAFLKSCFPDILHQRPANEAIKWSEDDGLIIKRKGSYNEATLEAWGLIEGMPTGKHFTHRIYDDITTMDLIGSPEQMQKAKDSFDMSDNLGTHDGTHRVVGTPYHHEDTLAYVKNKRDSNGEPVYFVRKKPTLEGGDWNGKPVLLSEERVNKLKGSPQIFKSQHLLDPTPGGTEVLNPDYLQYVEEEFIPKNLYKFMTVDPAGDNKDGKGDAWAILVLGVEPQIDEIGASKVYLLDAVITPLSHTQAIEMIARMYIEAGIVERLGVEKVGLSSVEIHVTNALRARGRHVSQENKNLILLKPRGRNKVSRIEQCLSWPLNNGKLFISSTVHSDYRNRLKREMEKFPYWHDDGLDAFAYLYDMLKEYRFTSLRDKLDKMKVFNNRVRLVDNVAGY